MFPFQSRILIALFWDDHDVNIAGQIFYRFSDDSLLVSEVGLNISSAFNTDFTPALVFIATWDGVAAFSGQNDVVSPKVIM